MREILDAVPAWLPGLGAMACLAAASGFFSMCETTLFHLTHDEIRAMRVGRPRERLAASLLGNADRLLTGILFWNLLANLGYFAIAAALVVRLAQAGHRGPAAVFGALAVLALVVLGDVLPRGVAVGRRRGLSTAVARPLSAALRLVDPVMPRMQRAARALRRTFWPRLTREPLLESADLERAVDASQQSDDVVRHERQVLHNVLDLSELTVEELMRPRGTYVTLAPPITLAGLRGQVPPGDLITVQDRAADDILSAIPLAGLTGAPDHGLESAGEDVAYLPWCATAASALQLLRDRFCSVASVVNEYGESIGIVVYEDLLDTILTHDPSRTRRVLHREPVVPAGDGAWEVEGFTTLRYLSRKLGVEFDPDADPVVTVRGLFFEQLEGMPNVGDQFAWRGFRLSVVEVTRRGQIRVRVVREAPT